MNDPNLTPLVALPVVVPMLLGILSVLLRGSLGVQRALSVGGMAVLVVMNAFLLVKLGSLESGAPPLLYSVAGSWPAPFGIAIMFDWLSGLLVTITSVIGLAASFHTMDVMPERNERSWFHPLLFLLIMGVSFSFLTGDLFNLFVGFEIMLMASYAMMCLDGSKRVLAQAYKYVIINLIGSSVFVLAAGMIYGVTGTLNFADLARWVSEMNTTEGGVPTAFIAVSTMLLFVFTLKAAVFPLWFWLPDSYPTMPTTVSALFAALLSKVGVYAVIRLYPTVFGPMGTPSAEALSPILAGMAAVTMILAIVMAIGAHSVRRVLLLVLMSHVGYLIAGVVIGSIDSIGSVSYYMMQEMLVMACLLMATGMLERHAGTDDLREFGGAVQRAPALGVVFFIASLAVAGIPPLAGFYGKAGLMREAFSTGNTLLGLCIVVTAALTFIAMGRVWCAAFWGELRGAWLVAPEGGTLGTAPRLGYAFAGVWILLAFAIGAGLLPGPAARATNAAAELIVEPAPMIDTILGTRAITETAEAVAGDSESAS
ncbi:MAG: proton-conducting transporter membrane subunit [Planctomycetota bacterium]